MDVSFFIQPLEAFLGSCYSLSGFAIPRWSKLLNHLVEHVEIVHFRIEKCLQTLLMPFLLFSFFFTLHLETIHFDLHSLLCRVYFGSGCGICFAALAARPLGQQREKVLDTVLNSPDCDTHTELYLCGPLWANTLAVVSHFFQVEGKKRGGKNDASAHMLTTQGTQAERVKRA